MSNGSIAFSGDINHTIDLYLKDNNIKSREEHFKFDTEPQKLYLRNLKTFDVDNVEKVSFRIGEPLKIKFEIKNNYGIEQCFDILFTVYNKSRDQVCQFSTYYNGKPVKLENDQICISEITINENVFLQGEYYLNVVFFKGTLANPAVLYKIEEINTFCIEGGNPFGNGIIPMVGKVILKSTWT